MPPTTLDVEPDLLPHQLPENRGRYSFGRAFRHLCRENSGPLDGLEAEVSQELARRGARAAKSGGEERSFNVPWDVEVRSVGTVDLTAAAGGLANIVRMPLIDVLRGKLVTARLGAQTIPGLKGATVAFPRRTSTVSLTYVADGVAPSASAQAIAQQAVMTPFSVGAYTDASRKVFVTIPDAEAMLIEDILTATAVDLDRAALNGTGTGTVNEPLGLLQGAASLQYSWGSNGAAPTQAGLAEMERLIGAANADLGPLGYVTSPAGKSKLRRTESFTGAGPIWRHDDRLSIGAAALSTSLVPSTLTHGSSGATLSASVLGDWSQLLFGLWGDGATIVVNPYIWAANGMIRTTVLTDYGIALKNQNAFCVSGDMVTT